MVFLWITGLLAALDLSIKCWIEKQENGAFPRLLKGTNGSVTLEKNHNTGFSFGILKEKQNLVRGLPLGVVFVLSGIFSFMLSRKGNTKEKVAIALILGGAISNLYDRLVRHYVVDYFSFAWKPVKHIVFNLGDLFIFLGTGIMLAAELWSELSNALRGRS